MDYLKFDFKLSIYLTLTFILMTVVGTLTHEFGHYSVSKILGYEASINYQSSSHWDDDLNEYLKDTYEKYSNEIKSDIDFPEKEKYQKVIQKYQSDNFWIVLGGPLETILTGSIGFMLFLVFRKRFITSDNVHFIGWTLMFISLFWLRQVANLFMAVMSLLLKGEPSQRGDEMRLANHLDINIWTIQLVTGLLGLSILAIVLRFLPKTLIMTFLISGLIGGILGYYLWLIKFGQYIMP
jgi:FtsH-binding integral membrane protein